MTTKPKILPPHLSIPVKVDRPTWLRADVIRTCWHCEKRTARPWISRLTGQCLCRSCYVHSFDIKPNKARRSRTGVRAWRA
jgi:hypothetical protein